MLAMFWTGVTIAAWGWAIRLNIQTQTVHGPRGYPGYNVLVLASLGWSSIFAAIWSLVGRANKGIIIGVGMWLLLLVLCYSLLV
jgi:hypothetical protein